MTKVRVQTILFGLVDGSFIRGVKECSDSLPFVLGGKHRSAGDQNVRSGLKKGCTIGQRHPAQTNNLMMVYHQSTMVANSESGRWKSCEHSRRM